MDGTAIKRTGKSSFTVGDGVHDLNNVLCVLACGIELAHDQIAEPDVLTETLVELERAIAKALEINRTLCALLVQCELGCRWSAGLAPQQPG